MVTTLHLSKSMAWGWCLQLHDQQIHFLMYFLNWYVLNIHCNHRKNLQWIANHTWQTVLLHRKVMLFLVSSNILQFSQHYLHILVICTCAYIHTPPSLTHSPTHSLSLCVQPALSMMQYLGCKEANFKKFTLTKECQFLKWEYYPFKLHNNHFCSCILTPLILIGNLYYQLLLYSFHHCYRNFYNFNGNLYIINASANNKLCCSSNHIVRTTLLNFLNTPTLTENS